MGINTINEGRQKYDEIQFFFRKHWTKFLRPLIFGLTVGLLAAFFFLILGSILAVFQMTVFYAFFAFMVVVFSIIYINIFFLPIFNYFFNVIIITDCRIIISRKTIFLKNDNESIDLTKIQDIGVIAHGIFRNYLNYGALIITLSTSAPQIVIPHVPDPHYFLEQMNRVKREHILRRQEGRKPQDKSHPFKPVDYLQDIDKLEYAS